ncbi:MAG: hypothetical protein NUV88_01410 [Candidatus Kaiserbacteria bacterium]|nr:hypothetical protein [Candidatus Kaiserbacteria bacterium]
MQRPSLQLPITLISFKQGDRFMILDVGTENEKQLNRNNRVLVLVRGGVAEIFSDDSSQVFMLDYDNEPNGSIPDRFIDLLSLRR